MPGKYDWAELAALAEAIPDERRQQIHDRLGFRCHPRYNLGVAAGVVYAYRSVAPDSPAAAVLRELAAVASAFAIEQERIYAFLCKPVSAHEVEETNALLERIRRGDEQVYPAEDVLREIDELLKRIGEEEHADTCHFVSES